MGVSKAKELLYFSDVIDGSKAFNLGIVNFLIDSKEIRTIGKTTQKINLNIFHNYF